VGKVPGEEGEVSMFKKGDRVIYFSGKHPKGKRDAIFVDAHRLRARITVIEDGKPRTFMVSYESLEAPRAELPGHAFMDQRGFG
jgi:hypothetical protein